MFTNAWKVRQRWSMNGQTLNPSSSGLVSIQACTIVQVMLEQANFNSTSVHKDCILGNCPYKCSGSVNVFILKISQNQSSHHTILFLD